MCRTGGTLSRPVFEIRSSGKGTCQSRRATVRAVPAGAVCDDARVRWSGSPRRGARRLHVQTLTPAKDCEQRCGAQSTGRAGVIPTSRRSAENHRAHGAPAGRRPPHTCTTAPQPGALLLDNQHFHRADRTPRPVAEQPTARRLVGETPCCRFAWRKPAPTRSPGRHARTSSKARVSAAPTGMPVSRRSRSAGGRPRRQGPLVAAVVRPLDEASTPRASCRPRPFRTVGARWAGRPCASNPAGQVAGRFV
jgi:hypothetical protein